MAYSLGTAVGAISLVFNGAGAAQARAAMGDLESQSGKSSSALGKLGAVGAVAGGLVAAGFGFAVNKAADFQEKMSGVKAVTGATSDEMDTLSAKAIKIGQDTTFSASEAADAIGELAKAGVSIPDIMNGAADATVALAAAGGVDLPTAANMAANAMNQFGLSASALPRVADLIAGAANASAIDVGQFGMSLSQSGAVAHLAGLSFDDTAVAIAELGNAGVVGSDAGTSLKTMLMNLQPTTKQQIALFDQLGITTDGTGNKFYDAQGHLKAFSDVQQILQDSLKGMTDQQKQATLETMFGTDAIRAAAIFADNGAKGFDTLAASMDKVKAADVAKTRMDNLKGAIENFKGSIETVAIQVGTTVLPAFQNMVQGSTGVVNKFGEMAPKIGDAITGIAALLGQGDFTAALSRAFGLEEDSPIVDTILNLRDQVVNAVTNIIDFLKNVGQGAVNLAAAFGPLVAEVGGGLVYAFSALSNILRPLGSAIAAATGFLRDHSTTVRAVTVGILAAYAAFLLWQTAIKIIALVKAAVLAFRTAMFLLNIVMSANPIGIIILALVALAAGFAYLWTHSESFRNFWIGLWKAVSGAVMAAIHWIVDAAKATWHWIEDYIVDPVVSAWDWVMGVFDSVKGWINEKIGLVVAVIKAEWELVKQYLIDPVVDAWNSVVDAFNAVKKWISDAISAIVGFVKDHWQLLLAIILGPLGLIIDAVVTHWDWIKAVFAAALAAIILTVQTVWGFIKDYIINPIIAVYNQIVSWWTTIYNFFVGIVTAIVTWIVTKWNEFVLGLQIIWTAISTTISTTWNNIYNFFLGIITAIVGWVLGKWNEFTTALSLIWTAISSAVSSTWNSIYGAISGVVSSVYNFVSSKIAAVRDFLSGVWNSISSTASTIWNSVYSAISGVITSIVSSVTGVGQSIKDAFSGALQWLVDAGKNIVTGLWNGISGAAGWIKQQIQGFVSGIKDNVLGFFGIKSPSRMFMEIGGYLTAGLGKGIVETRSVYVDPALDSLAQAVQMRMNMQLAATYAGSKANAPGADPGLRMYIPDIRSTATANSQAAAPSAAAAPVYDIDVYNPPQPTTESQVLAAMNQAEALYA